MQNPNNTGKGRRRFRRRFRRRGNIGRVAFKMVRRLKRDINLKSELKFVDLLGTFSNTVITNAGSLQYITGISQGSNTFNRLGSRITLESVLIRISVYPSTVTLTGNSLRLIVFQDKNNQGASPAIGDLLAGSNPTVNPLVANNTMRFRIIADRLYSVIADECVNDKIYVKLSRNRSLVNPIQYSGTAAAVTSAGQGALFWLLASEDLVNGPIVTASCRVRFRDD